MTIHRMDGADFQGDIDVEYQSARCGDRIVERPHDYGQYYMDIYISRIVWLCCVYIKIYVILYISVCCICYAMPRKLITVPPM